MLEQQPAASRFYIQDCEVACGPVRRRARSSVAVGIMPVDRVVGTSTGLMPPRLGLRKPVAMP